MDSFFVSCFEGGMTIGSFLLCLAVSFISGMVLAAMSFYRSDSSKNFYITTALLPMSVAMVIALVNGNIGVGVAVAGAFALVRFRSAPGNAREICVIFISMASGLAYGVGYLSYGAIFTLIAGGILMVLTGMDIFEHKSLPTRKILRITIPEDLNYGEVFEDLFEKYTNAHLRLKVKTVNMGSMFRITYDITMKDASKEKEFIDELRCRNGNLEIFVADADMQEKEL